MTVLWDEVVPEGRAEATGAPDGRERLKPPLGVGKETRT